jgi:alkaline phosphatase D
MKQPTVGPLIGQNTTELLRVMVRGDADNKKASIIVFEDKQCEVMVAKRTIDLKVSYDYCNVFLIPYLEPRKYYYKVAIHKNDIDIEETHKEIDTLYTTKIVSFSGQTNFLMGSCRYIMETIGFWMFGEQSDKAFRTALVEAGVRDDAIDFMLHLGDQIYADDLNALSSDVHLENFFAKYRYAYTTPYFKEMAARIGNYMILDDHEIEDNWPDDRKFCDKKKYFNAMHSYQVYQASHGPAVNVEYNVDQPVKLKENPSKWYYTYSSGESDFFVLDVRTERIIKGNTKMISDLQMRELKTWLLTEKERPKCIASSVPFLMNTVEGAPDKWADPRFVAQRNEILEFIYENEITKVVFLSGDIHANYVCSATKRDGVFATKPIKVYQIVSSPLFFPYSFLNKPASDYILSGTIPDSVNWVSQKITRVIEESGIAKVSIDSKGFEFTFFSRKGELIKNCKCTFEGRTENDIKSIKVIEKQEKKKAPSFWNKLKWTISKWIEFIKSL